MGPIPFLHFSRLMRNSRNHQKGGVRRESVFVFVGFFFFLLFLGLNLWHMEVPRLWVKLELQMPAYATATVTRDPSHICNLHHSSWQHWIPNPQVRPGIEPASSWIRFRFLIHSATTGTPFLFYFYWSIVDLQCCEVLLLLNISDRLL